MCLFRGYRRVASLSPPLKRPDRVCVVRHVGERFAGELALVIFPRPLTDLSRARVPEGLIHSRERRHARDQVLIMRLAKSSQLLFALSRNRGRKPAA